MYLHIIHIYIYTYIYMYAHMYMFMICMCACICVLCTCICARHTRAQIFKYSHAHIPPRADLLGPSKVMIKGGRDFLMPSFPFGQSSDYARQAWNFYCDCHGSGVRDPRRPGLSLESVLRWRRLNMSCWVATWDPYKLFGEFLQLHVILCISIPSIFLVTG